MLYLARGGFWLSLGDGVSSIIGFLTAIAFSNFLPREVYGSYKYVLSVAGILSIASLSGVGAAVTQAVAQGFEGSFVPAVKTKMRWGLFGSLGGLLVAGYYFTHGNTSLGIAFLLVSLFIPFLDSFSLYSAYLEGKKLFDISTRYRMYSQLISAGVLIGTIYLTSNLFLVLSGYFLSLILTNFVFYRIAKAKIKPNTSISPLTNSFGKHLSFLGALNIISGQLDKILLWNVLGASSLAVYLFALAPVNQMLGFVKSILPLAFPKMAERTEDELRHTLPYKILLMLAVIAVLVATYILAAPFLFKIFFSKYTDSILYSQIFALTLLFFPRNLLSDALVAHGKTKKIYILSIVGSAFRFTAMAILIGKFGIWGAVYSAIASGMFSFALATYLFFRRS